MKIKTRKVWQIDVPQEKYDWSIIDKLAKRASWRAEYIGKRVHVSGVRKKKYEMRYFYSLFFRSERTAVKVWGALNL